MKRTPLRDISIRQKLTLLMMLTSGMALLVTGVALLGYELLTYRPKAAAELRAEAERVGYYSAPAIKFEAEASAAQTLNVLEKHSEIWAAALYKADGTIFVRFQRSKDEPFPLPSTAPNPGFRFMAGYLELTSPIMEEGAVVGSVLLVSDLSAVYARLGQQAGILVGIILLSAVASYLLAARLQPLVASPVLSLARAARLVREKKDYTVRVEEVGHDEVGLLIEAFNQMLGTIQEHEKQLVEKRDELEMQVQARTAELSKAYDALQANEEQLQSILDNTTAVIYIKDTDGKYLLINRRYENLFHVTRDVVHGKTDYDIFPKEAADAFRKNDATVLATGKVLQIEEQAPHADGLHTYLSVKFPLADPNGRLHAICGISTDITARKRAEEELREREERFRTLVANVPGVSYRCACDEHWTMEFISDEIETLSGYPASDFLENRVRSYASIIHPEDREMVTERVMAGVSGTEPFSIEYRILSASGAIHWVFEKGQGIFGENGELRCLDGVIVDITEQKKAQEELRRNEELTRTWLNQTTDGIWDWNLITDDVYLSPRFKAMFGYGDDELENTAAAWHKIIYPEDLTLMLEAFRAHIERGQPFNLPVRHRHKNGSLVWVICRGVALKNREGRFDRMLGTLTDICRLKQVEDSLRQSENAFRQTVMNAPMPAVVLPDTGEIMLGNRAWTELSGYDTAEASTIQTWAEKALRQSKDSFLARFEEVRAIRGMGRLAEGQFHVWTKNGEERVWEFFASKLGKLPDRRRLFIIMAIDVTDRQRAEEQLQAKSAELERSNRELEQFAYIASHDLQEPLRTVGSFTQLLAQKVHGKIDSETDEFMGFIVDGAKRSQRLINDLLQYSRVGTRGKPFVAVDCNESIKDALANLYVAIDEKKAEVNVASLPTIQGDPTQLPQLFQNLISNGLKFQKAGVTPRIDVTARQVDSEWEFTVADNGIGIAPQFFDRIFAIFQRLHRREEYPGTGIGLAVCKRIVERHGGRIWVESEPGAGARFKFTIPLNPSQPYESALANGNKSEERSRPS